MTRSRVLVLGLALLAVARLAADDDPEPPPPVKVSHLKAVMKVQVRTKAGGPLLIVEPAAGARGTQSLQLDFKGKSPPARITLRLKQTDRLAIFGVFGANKSKDRAILRITGQGQQAVHFDANGAQLTDGTKARLSITYTPGKEVEVVVVRHKGKTWPGPPLHVAWMRTLKKKG